MSAKRSFKVGRVRVYLRSKTWYVCYYEGGRRKRYRAHSDRKIARRMAAEVNAQLETDAQTSFSFDRVSMAELRKRWLSNSFLNPPPMVEDPGEVLPTRRRSQ